MGLGRAKWYAPACHKLCLHRFGSQCKLKHRARNQAVNGQQYRSCVGQDGILKYAICQASVSTGVRDFNLLFPKQCLHWRGSIGVAKDGAMGGLLAHPQHAPIHVCYYLIYFVHCRLHTSAAKRSVVPLPAEKQMVSYHFPSKQMAQKLSPTSCPAPKGIKYMFFGDVYRFLQFSGFVI